MKPNIPASIFIVAEGIEAREEAERKAEEENRKARDRASLRHALVSLTQRSFALTMEETFALIGIDPEQSLQEMLDEAIANRSVSVLNSVVSFDVLGLGAKIVVDMRRSVSDATIELSCPRLVFGGALYISHRPHRESICRTIVDLERIRIESENQTQEGIEE